MDLYSILGVARSASADEIERAYRKLARRYHPGLNPGDRHAEERYRQLEHAYRVLADDERRHDYDLRGTLGERTEQVEARVSFAGFDFSAPADGPSAATFSELFADVFQHAAQRAIASDRGVDLHTTLALSFADAIRGGRFAVAVVRQEQCSTCGGAGVIARDPLPCPECEGQGMRRWARGHMVFTRHCDRCGGVGHLVSQPCRTCSGAGVQPRAEHVMVDIPPGVERDARLVVAGAGHASRQGIAGDLYVTVQVADHPFFRRSGRDLLLTLPVAVHEAALGARVEVPTLNGPARLRIPPGTPSGQQFRLRGRGVPGHAGADDAGDLLVQVQIVLPPIRDERSKELLREFGRLNDVDVRRSMLDS